MTALSFLAANSLFWAAVHTASGSLGHLLPSSVYRYDAWLFRTRPWEAGGRLYKRRFRIDTWKDKLPEAGELLGIHPFNKRRLHRHDVAYLERFLLETCRAELTHLLPFAFYPFCLLWNPPIGAVISFAYALLANVPFVMVQRYNRARLVRVVEARRLCREEPTAAPPASGPAR